MWMARLGSAVPPFSVSPSGPFHPTRFHSCVSDGGTFEEGCFARTERPSRPRVVYGVRRNGSPGSPIGPTLREITEGLLGRGQFTPVIFKLSEVSSLQFSMTCRRSMLLAWSFQVSSLQAHSTSRTIESLARIGCSMWFGPIWLRTSPCERLLQRTHVLGIPSMSLLVVLEVCTHEVPCLQ